MVPTRRSPEMTMESIRQSLRILAAVAGVGVTVGVITVPHAETLIEALADTYTTNPGLQAQRARLRAVDEQVPQALSNWRPSVTVSSRYTLSETQRRGLVDVDTRSNQHSVQLNLSQPLFRGFRTQAATARAEQRVAAERARLLSTEQRILFEAISSYMNVVRERAVLELNQSNVDVLRRQLEATEDRFRVGELTRTDVAQAQSRLQRAVAEQVNARGNLTSATAAYVNVVGHTPGDLAFPELPGDTPPTEQEATDAARSDNPDVVAADFDERAARRDVDLVRGELYPTLSLNGTLSHSLEMDGPDTQVNTESLTANLSVPLYQSGGVYSRLRAAKQTSSQRLSLFMNAQREAVERATRAWENLQTALANIEAFESEVRAQEIAHEGVQEEARVGARTILDVLDAQQELLDSRVSLVRVQRDANVASYELFSAVGRLTAQDLSLPVDRYDYSAYFDNVRNRWFGANID
jgi:outer membrane protein